MSLPRPTWIAFLVLGTAACRALPDAPDDLDALCAWTFAGFAAEDPAALEVGVAHLATWLEEHPGDAADGYTVENLDGEALAALDDRTRSCEGLVGATVTTESPHPATALAEALLVADQTAVFPDTYDVFERTFLTDPDCFVTRRCGWAEVENHAVSSMALGIDLSNDSTGQFRWVHTEDGPALLTRSWMHAPADVDVAWLDVDAQYNLTVTLPTAVGDVRLSTLWVDAQTSGVNVSERTILGLMIRGVQKNDETLYEWVSEQAQGP